MPLIFNQDMKDEVLRDGLCIVVVNFHQWKFVWETLAEEFKMTERWYDRVFDETKINYIKYSPVMGYFWSSTISDANRASDLANRKTVSHGKFVFDYITYVEPSEVLQEGSVGQSFIDLGVLLKEYEVAATNLAKMEGEIQKLKTKLGVK